MSREIVISLTSFPARIHGVHLTIRSLLNQTYKATKIVLWLAEDQFPKRENDLPSELLELRSALFEIRWCEDLRSYKKLIPSLRAFPDATIITVDDDIIYERNLVAKLTKGSAEYPDCVVVSRATKMNARADILFAETGGASYWRGPSYLNKLVGCSGCLYPAGCLNEEALDSSAFMSNASTSDDLWFWFMAVKNHTKIYRIPDGEWLPKENPMNSGLEALTAVNDADDGLFYRHLDNLLRAYPDVREAFFDEAAKRREDAACCGSEYSAKKKLKRIGTKARRLPFLRAIYAQYLSKRNSVSENTLVLKRRVQQLEYELYRQNRD